MADIETCRMRAHRRRLAWGHATPCGVFPINFTKRSRSLTRAHQHTIQHAHPCLFWLFAYIVMRPSIGLITCGTNTRIVARYECNLWSNNGVVNNKFPDQWSRTRIHNHILTELLCARRIEWVSTEPAAPVRDLVFSGLRTTVSIAHHSHVTIYWMRSVRNDLAVVLFVCECVALFGRYEWL